MFIDGKLIIDNADVQKARKGSFGSGTFEGVAAIELEAWFHTRSMTVMTPCSFPLRERQLLPSISHPLVAGVCSTVLDCMVGRSSLASRSSLQRNM